MERARNFPLKHACEPAAAAHVPAKHPEAALAGPQAPITTASGLTDVIHNSPAMSAQRRQIRHAFGDAAQLETRGGDAASPAAVQRRVHRWTGEAWNPGQAGREGAAAFPQQPDAENPFFNDVTGTVGKTAKGAAEGLKDLAVKEGSVATLMADGGSSLAEVDAEMKKTFSHEDMNQTQFLGFFTFSQADETWKWDAGGDDCPEGSWKEKTSAFLKGFMIANGQMDYIRTRDWYTTGSHVVEVDVNYYINRAFNSAPPYWHKDTGGGNLFVNLIFTNSEPIVGTEVTADSRPMGDVKKASLLSNMPVEQVQDIESTRDVRRGPESAKKIGAGLLPKMGFVSWVDELSWHSSPFMASRKKWSLALAKEAMENYVAPQPFFKVETATSYEAMVQIASVKDTVLWTMLKGDVHSMDIGRSNQLWNQGYHLGGKLGSDVESDIAKVDWPTHKLNEVFGHEQDGEDPRVAKPEGYQKPATLVTPSDLGGRARALSDADTRENLKPYAVSEMGRNFLRSWVRIKPKPK